MDLYKKLNLKPVKSEPEVWISRLAILEQINPHPVFIRDIPLSRGLNIIWAEDSEDDNPSFEITGHSAGKTTFCRLMRYVLGEKTFGTRTNMELIQKSLPNGYVAAELQLKGQKCSVLRPIGKGRNSYFKFDLTVEELLQDRSQPTYLETYAKDIGLEKLLDNLETGGIVRTGESIEWERILAWCTRDQEARFQNIYEWRSHRSESDTPAFRFPKAGPLFVMRTTLGLFLPDELKGEEELAELLQHQEKLEKEIENLKREPQFRINLYDTELRRRLRNILLEYPDIETLPLDSGNLLPDMNRLTMTANDKIKNQIEKLEKDQKVFQEEIDNIGATIRHLENRLNSLDNLFGLEQAAGQELDAGINKRQEVLKLFNDFIEQDCTLASIPYRNCQYVQDRYSILKFTEIQDANAMKQDKAKRTEARHLLGQQKQQICDKIDSLRKQRQNFQIKRDTLLTEIRGKREELRDLKQAREEVEAWTKKRDQAGEYKKLDECRKKLEETTDEIKTLEQQLSKLLKEHDENRNLLATIFSGAVLSVLSSGTYDGQVSLNNRELAFSITHGAAMSGEAVETLSVLLSDIASLIYNTVSANAHLPGFLLHDSPREADLGISLYSSFIRFVASLQQHFGKSDNCPFQYILTTTTAPPKELQRDYFVKLRLNAAQPSGLLLKRNIATISDDSGTNLFS